MSKENGQSGDLLTEENGQSGDLLTEDDIRAMVDKMSRGYLSDPEICARACTRYGHFTAEPLVDGEQTQVSLPGFAAEKNPT